MGRLYMVSGWAGAGAERLAPAMAAAGSGSVGAESKKEESRKHRQAARERESGGRERRAVRRGREGATPCDEKERAGAGEAFDARTLTWIPAGARAGVPREQKWHFCICFSSLLLKM